MGPTEDDRAIWSAAGSSGNGPNPSTAAAPLSAMIERFLKRIKRLIWLRSSSDPYVCIRCGTSFSRQVASCDECGSPHVALNQDDQ